MRERGLTSIGRCACGLVILLAMAACTDQEAGKKIAAFAGATDLVIRNTNSAFDLVERSYEDAEIARIVTNFNLLTFHPESAKKFFPAKDLDSRKLVLAGLKQYAATLAAIMSNDKLGELDTSAKALGKSLTDMNATLVKQNILNHSLVSDADTNAFTTAVNTLGRWFVEQKREKAVRENVRTMQGIVKDITRLLVQDIGTGPFGEDAPRAGMISQSTLVTAGGMVSQTAVLNVSLGLRAQLWNNYSEIIRQEADFIGHNEAKLSPIEKREEIKRLLSLIGDRKSSDDTIQAVATALKQLDATHDQLVKAFDKKDFTLVQTISSLVAEGERIKAFYDALAKKP